MTRTTATNIALSTALVLAFPVLWIYNQKINYRPVLSLDTKFSLRANHYNSEQLASVNEILDYLITNKIETKLLPKVITSSSFSTIGRIVQTKYGNWEIYEYENPQAAARQLSVLGTGATSLNVYQYKNFLINDLASVDIPQLVHERL